MSRVNDNGVVGEEVSNVNIGEIYDMMVGMDRSEIEELLRKNRAEYKSHTNSMMPGHSQVFRVLLKKIADAGKLLGTDNKAELAKFEDILATIGGAMACLATPRNEREEGQGSADLSLREMLQGHYEYIKNVLSTTDPSM